METVANARRMVAERGPRYVVTGNIRPGEVACSYAPTAERAEEIRRDYEEHWGYYQVTVYPPEQCSDEVAELRRLGDERAAAQRALDEVTSKARALVIRMVGEGALSEVEAARLCRVTRMTIRAWLGKR